MVKLWTQKYINLSISSNINYKLELTGTWKQPLQTAIKVIPGIGNSTGCYSGWISGVLRQYYQVCTNLRHTV